MSCLKPSARERSSSRLQETPRRYAVLLISHGSPHAEWNASQQVLQGKVEAALKSMDSPIKSSISAVRWAWLEFAKPDIKDSLDAIEAEAIADHVIAIPVFISVSSHTERDIPNCLNSRFTPESDDDLPRYLGRLPITYCSPMDHGMVGVLPSILADKAKEVITCEPLKTAVITVSHGDGCEHFWGHLHARIANSIGEAVPKLRSNTHCYIQTLRKPFVQKRLLEAIRAAIEDQGCENVAVLSCFNGTSGAMFLSRLQDMYIGRLTEKDDNFATDSVPLEKRFPNAKIFGDSTWMGDPRVVDWVVDMADKCARCLEGKPAEPDEHQPPYNPPFTLTRDKNADLEKLMAPMLGKGKGKGGHTHANGAANGDSTKGKGKH